MKIFFYLDPSFYSMNSRTILGHGKKRGGGSKIHDWTYARRGGSFRCVLCATGGVGGSKNREKMRM